jgi:hypothetical protein
MSSIVIIYTTSIRYKIENRINGVMVCVLALSAVAHYHTQGDHADHYSTSLNL